MFQKGHKGNPKGRGKGALNKETLTKLERRAVFDKKISEKWEQTIDKLNPEYIANQFMGTAPTKVDLSNSDGTLKQIIIIKANENSNDKTPSETNRSI